MIQMTMNPADNTPLVLAITGASAQPLGLHALKLLLENNLHVALILSKGAYEVNKAEMNQNIPLSPLSQEKYWRDVLGTKKGYLTCYKWNDLSADIASGSTKTKGMVIIPCSMGKISRIASGSSQDLVERCADVHLKEYRKLIISPRETPYNLIHLQNLLRLAECGVKIVPPVPAWYSKPKSIEDIVHFIVVRTFDLLDLNLATINRWKGNE